MYISHNYQENSQYEVIWKNTDVHTSLRTTVSHTAATQPQRFTQFHINMQDDINSNGIRM